MHEVDEETRLEEIASGTYRGFITDRWNIGTVPSGCYVLAIGMAALREVLPHPDSLSVTVAGSILGTAVAVLDEERERQPARVAVVGYED